MKFSNSQILKFSNSQILKFSNSQILKFSNSQILLLFLMLMSFQLSAQRRCNSALNLQELKRNNRPAYDRFMRLEQFTNDYKQRLKASPNDRLINDNGPITIPVVVHVIHNEAAAPGSNISDAQIFSQMATLNDDYNRLNADQSNTPSVFQSVAGNLNFQFVLACYAPNGYYTNGINRVQTSRTIFPFTSLSFDIYDNDVKHSEKGGVNAWPTERYLNIWVCSIDDDIQGYGTFPSEFPQYPNLDGVIVNYKAFGSIGTATAPFNKGRSLTHEIGHWLNLIHTAADDGGACSGTDYCDDTPNQGGYTYGGPGLVFGSCSNCQKSCGNQGNMFMNFMDYTDDAYMNLFTNDQKIRARAVFQPGGPRRSFIDNYFFLSQLHLDCTRGYYLVRTPFCEAQNNITWDLTGPATRLTNSSTFGTIIPQVGANGTAVLSASWNNMVSDVSIPIGWGDENSTYNINSSNSVNEPLIVGSYNLVGCNRWTNGKVSFTGATGQAKNWRITLNSSSSPAYIFGYTNDFGVQLTQPFQLVKVEAEIPTLCGDKTVAYYFTGGFGFKGDNGSGSSVNFAISPNPATNQINIQSSLSISDSDNKTGDSNTGGYEVQIFNNFNQLMKKAKCPQGNRDITIDVANLPSNQFYTVKLISDNDVQSKSFFKQ
jgi:hypothetical protein